MTNELCLRPDCMNTRAHLVQVNQKAENLNDWLDRLKQENTTLRERLAAAEAMFVKCEKAMQEAIIRVCFIGHPKEPIYMDGERRVPDWSKALNMMQEARKEMKEAGWLKPQPQAETAEER